jgi:hypothetical protein
MGRPEAMASHPAPFFFPPQSAAKIPKKAAQSVSSSLSLILFVPFGLTRIIIF